MTNVMTGWRLLRDGGADTQVTGRLEAAAHSIEDRGAWLPDSAGYGFFL